MCIGKRKIYIIGCTMWDIIGKPTTPLSVGTDCTGHINEKPGGVAFNIAVGLSKILHESCFELHLVSAIGKDAKSNFIFSILNKYNIGTQYLAIKGKKIDKYLSIETKNGEIFGSINSPYTFLENQNYIKENFHNICSEHKRANKNAILIFDGNCPKSFLDYAKEQASDKLFTKYFIPANFSKLSAFKNNAIYFKGFNLIINLQEANILLGSNGLKNSTVASKEVFEEIKSEKNLTIVTDGPNIACGVSNKELVKVKPKILESSVSRLGAGDAFFAYFLSFKELNPEASLEESLRVATKKTEKYLQTNDKKISK